MDRGAGLDKRGMKGRQTLWEQDVEDIDVGGMVMCVAFRRSGLGSQSVYAGIGDGRILEYDLETKGNLSEFDAHNEPVNDLKVSMDGRLLVSCYGGGLRRRVYEIPALHLTLLVRSS